MTTGVVRQGIAGLRLLLAGSALFALWSWSPSPRNALPTGFARPMDASALVALPADTTFLLSGHVDIADDADASPWQGRGIYRHRARRDHGGHGSSRQVMVETISQQRPALQFRWRGGMVDIAADSYRLDHAPRIEPRFGDDWDRSSRGFHDGDAALVLGRTGSKGRYWIESLLQAPLEAVQADIAREHRKRLRLVTAAKVLASLLVLSLLLSPERKRRTSIVQ